MNNRRKFRSQTFDNMDRWKAEMGRVREEKRREEKRRKKHKKKQVPAPPPPPPLPPQLQLQWQLHYITLQYSTLI